jgi:lysophospholipase L1-like esterase
MIQHNSIDKSRHPSPLAARRCSAPKNRRVSLPRTNGQLRVFLALAIFGLLLSAIPRPLHAEEAFFLKGGETVVFFGDSITQNGQYINYVEAYLLTRFPCKSFRLINHGISSETISGTSEDDHTPRRPWAHPRFTRDIAEWKPDVVVACFGMNDGNYHPFEPTRFAKYQEGVERLISRTRDEAQARLVLMTPPPFDPYRRRASDPEAVAFGYKFPAIDYDETLGRYSQWLLTLRSPDLMVVDLHANLNAHLRKRRASKASFHLAPDAVHPNATGHWLMAQQLLLAWNAPAGVAEARIDAGSLKAAAGKITDLGRREQTVSFVWDSPLPLPLDADWDAESIALEQVAERISRYRLSVANLPASRYRLSVDGNAIADVESKELESGLDLTQYAQWSTNQRSRQLLALVKERRRLAYGGWREQIGQPLGTRGDEARMAAIAAELEDLRQPRKLRIELRPVGN